MQMQSKHRKVATRLIGIAACALILSACEGRREITGSVPDDYRLRHPITLEQSARTIDVPVGIHSEKLTPANRSAISNFAREFNRERAARVQIMVPAGSDNENSARYVSRHIRKELIRAGVQAGQIETVAYSAGQATDAPVRLAYPRVEAKVPECGFYPDQLGKNYDNRSYFNFGCSTQANLARQVANPQDLVQPRGWDPRDSGRRGVVNEKFRNGEPTWSEDLGSDVGSSSEVQQ